MRMLTETGRTLGRARLTTIALATAAFITISASVLAERAGTPALDVPYVPTPPEVVERMLDMADVKPGDFVIDLGSGDGRIAIAAAKRGARAFGVDIDPQRVEEAQLNARRAGVEDKAAFSRQNLFETRIAEATVLTMYLLQKVNLDLRPRVLDELKPGTRVVSHAFSMGEWKPDDHAEVGFRQVYMWIVPAKVAGRWHLQDGAESFSLTLEQEYQYLKGRAQIGGQTVEVREGRLAGTDISLTLANGWKYRGRVDGDRMEAVPQSVDDKKGSWRGERVS
jgi:SAM-dependent methyltransferase